MTNTLKGFGVIVLMLITLTLILLSGKTPSVSAAGFQVTNIGSVATTSSRTSVTVSTRILATTTNTTDPANSHARVYATICNPSATVVYLRLDGDKPVDINSAAAYPIAAAAGYNACYIINDQNTYYGSVTASSTNQTAAVLYTTEYVQ